MVAACSSTAQPAAVPLPTTTTTVPATSRTVFETTTTTTTIVLDPLNHVFPIPEGANVSYARTHSGYPATDVFAACGTDVLAMATGFATDVRAVDRYIKADDNPALRGGPSVGIVGDDGVRYYTSHLDRVDVTKGERVTVGKVIGNIGLTGDSTACHIHVGISTPCPEAEWKVRRGTIYPWPYFDAWRTGVVKSPVDEVSAWLVKNPEACADAAADPFAIDAR